MVYQKLTEQERAARREADRQRIAHAARALLSSDGWQRWVAVRARNGLSRYSFSNQMLIATAKPNATYIAGFKAWLDLGYCVRKGERAIRIFAPLRVKERDLDTGEETGETLMRFRVVSVFDRSQVDPLPSGEPVALDPPAQPINGESHAHLLEPLTVFAKDLGFTVSIEQIPGSAGGWCDFERKQIVVDASEPGNARVRTVIHELAHALGVDYAHYGRKRAEVIVDTVTFIVASSVGLDVGGESIPYIAGWGQDGAIDAVTEFAQTIDKLARRIENALDPTASQTSPDTASEAQATGEPAPAAVTS